MWILWCVFPHHMRDTSDPFICSARLRDDPTAIPFFKNEEDLSVYTEFISTPHDSLEQHSTCTWFEGKSVPHYDTVVNVANFINFKCLPDFAAPLPNIFMQYFSDSKKPLLGCYIPYYRFTCICIKYDLDCPIW